MEVELLLHIHQAPVSDPGVAVRLLTFMSQLILPDSPFCNCCTLESCKHDNDDSIIKCYEAV